MLGDFDEWRAKKCFLASNVYFKWVRISLNFVFVMFANQKNTDNMHISFGGIAQLVERLHGMQEVSGSIPLTSTKILKA